MERAIGVVVAVLLAVAGCGGGGGGSGLVPGDGGGAVAGGSSGAGGGPAGTPAAGQTAPAGSFVNVEAEGVEAGDTVEVTLRMQPEREGRESAREAAVAEFTVALTAAEDGRLSVPVPPVLDPDTGRLVPGTVEVWMEGRLLASGVPVAVPEAPPGEPGGFTAALLEVLASRCRAAAGVVEQLEEDYGGDAPDVKAALNAQAGELDEIVRRLREEGELRFIWDMRLQLLSGEDLREVDRYLYGLVRGLAGAVGAEAGGRVAPRAAADADDPAEWVRGWSRRFSDSLERAWAQGRSGSAVLTGLVGLTAGLGAAAVGVSAGPALLVGVGAAGAYTLVTGVSTEGIAALRARLDEGAAESYQVGREVLDRAAEGARSLGLTLVGAASGAANWVATVVGIRDAYRDFRDLRCPAEPGAERIAAAADGFCERTGGYAPPPPPFDGHVVFVGASGWEVIGPKGRKAIPCTAGLPAWIAPGVMVARRPPAGDTVEYDWLSLDEPEGLHLFSLPSGFKPLGIGPDALYVLGTVCVEVGTDSGRCSRWWTGILRYTWEAMQTGREPKRVLLDLDGDGSSDVWEITQFMVDPGGKRLYLLTTRLPEDRYGLWCLSCRPDGSDAAIVEDLTGVSDARITGVASGSPVRMVLWVDLPDAEELHLFEGARRVKTLAFRDEGAPFENLEAVILTPDGGWLVGEALNRAQGVLALVSWSGKRQRYLELPEYVVPRALLPYRSLMGLGATGSGDLIVVPNQNGPGTVSPWSDVYAVDPDTGRVKNLTKTPEQNEYLEYAY